MGFIFDGTEIGSLILKCAVKTELVTFSLSLAETRDFMFEGFAGRTIFGLGKGDEVGLEVGAEAPLEIPGFHHSQVVVTKVFSGDRRVHDGACEAGECMATPGLPLRVRVVWLVKVASVDAIRVGERVDTDAGQGMVVSRAPLGGWFVHLDDQPEGAVRHFGAKAIERRKSLLRSRRS